MSTSRLVALGVALLAAALAAVWLLRDDSRLPDGPGGPSAPATPGGAAAEGDGDAMVVIFPSVHDRFWQAPCNLVPGDGLASFSTVLNTSRAGVGYVLSVCLGDVCTLRGPLGAATTNRLIRDMLAPVGVQVVAAGTGELQHGSAFVRDALSAVADLHVLCANAADPEGRAVLRGWSAATAADDGGRVGRTVLFVGVAGQSIAPDLLEAGSDIVLVDPIATVREALADAEERMRVLERRPDIRVLLVHGTEDEAAEILAAVPGFDLAAAADGPVLPTLDPRIVSGVPIVYPGADARFVIWATVRGRDPVRVEPNLSRLGRDLLTRGDKSRGTVHRLVNGVYLESLPSAPVASDPRPLDPRGDYAGAAACADCHADVAARHEKSRHRSPPERWARSTGEGSPQCLPCHVTAPGWRGGFNGPPDKSPMRGVSCEACHGPGAGHAAMPAPGYGAVRWETCLRCHQPEYSPGFDAASAWDRVGHGPR